MDKKVSRLRRARRGRATIRRVDAHRLCVYRTPRHIYAQVIAPEGGNVVASASTLDPQIKGELKGTGNVSAAAVVGKYIAQRAQAAGITAVAFDRSGYKYHGRIQALADAARESGLKF